MVVITHHNGMTSAPSNTVSATTRFLTDADITGITPGVTIGLVLAMLLLTGAIVAIGISILVYKVKNSKNQVESGDSNA